ncbi:MAG: cobaltochelatase subunit CobT [Rhodospirillales bacterium]|nr:cobaltochelatase subunit CobT [Rhodospirillales bacterium]
MPMDTGEKDHTKTTAIAAALRAIGRKKDEQPDAATLESRGRADARAVHLRHHDPALHQRNRPMDLTAQECFNALERARCEALGYNEMKGIAKNLHAELEEKSAAYEGLSSREDLNTAEALYLLARLSLTGEDAPAPAEKTVALWQPWLAEQLGAARLDDLRECLSDQAAFAHMSRQILKQLSIVSDGDSLDSESPSEQDAEDGDGEAEPQDEDQDDTTSDSSGGSQAQDAADDSSPSDDTADLGEEEMDADTAMEGEAAEQTMDTAPPDSMPDGDRFIPGLHGRYTIYTTKYDEIVRAENLAEPEELDRLRALLDRKLSHLTAMITRLANRLQRKLMSRQQHSWQFDMDEGVLDTARLARVIANPTVPLVFKQEKSMEFRDTVVTLLIDNSGSMRGRPIAIAAMCADILARTLERCGVSVEVLGFTTRAWKGGKARELWITNGRPPEPGRLNDLRHIIYKSAKTPYRRARRNIGLMLKEGLLKENIDGEALSWAHNRISARPEQRKILMVISDGAPVDDSTLSVNPANILDLDLKNVIQWIEKSETIELMAIGIGHDVTRYYSHAVTIEDASTLAETLTNELIGLFDD